MPTRRTAHPAGTPDEITIDVRDNGGHGGSPSDRGTSQGEALATAALIAEEAHVVPRLLRSADADDHVPAVQV